MTIFQSVVLGIVQGLTEFIPVSSSAHLVLVPYLLDWNLPNQDVFSFYVLVQVASLLGVFIYFRKDLVEIIRAFVTGIRRRRPFDDTSSLIGWYILLATVPAGFIGLLFKSAIERTFSDPLVTAGFLWGTALLLVIAEWSSKRQRKIDLLTWKDALWIGFFQVLALFPGVSRSGATITGGMTRHLERPVAARFAFLMSIPVMLAAGLLASLDLAQSPNLAAELLVFSLGFMASAVTGYLAIKWLLRYLSRHSLYIFSIYCVLLSLIVLGVSLLK